MVNLCSECRAGEIIRPATHLVITYGDARHDYANLRRRKWVCEDHYELLREECDIVTVEKHCPDNAEIEC